MAFQVEEKPVLPGKSTRQNIDGSSARRHGLITEDKAVARQRIGVTSKFRAAIAIGGLGVLFTLVLWGAGCSRNSSEYSQFPPNADGLFATSIRPPAGDIDRLLRNAHYLKLMGRPDQALRELEAAYHQDPRNIKVLNALALACDEMGEFPRAQKLYQEALALDVANQAVNNNLCFSYYLAGQWDQAETCFRQALTRNPQNLMARNNLGLLLCRRGRTGEARRLWEGAEGKIAAQKKMEQVTVALGIADNSHLAQLPASTPATSSPLPQISTASPAADQNATSPKVALPRAAAPAPPVPVASPAKAQESLQPASHPAPAAASPPAKETPALKTAAKPAAPQPKKPTPPVRTERTPTSVSPVAKPAPAVVREKAAPKIPATPSIKAQSPPPAPSRTADIDRKPAPAATPPPQAKPSKVKVAAAPSSQKADLEKQPQSRIEVANGTHASNLARQNRARLKEQGFNVVTISNNHGTRAEETVIYYRPEVEQVARAISANFYPQSRLEIGEKFAKNTNIKVVLGHDLADHPHLADNSSLKAEKIAAGSGSNPQKSPPAAAAAHAPVAAPAPAPAKAPASVPGPVHAAAATEAGPQRNQERPYLTAAELIETGIEIRNGTPTPDLAHKTRSMLSQEGFNVVQIGNHIDFGAEKTIIFYRPGAEKLARNLSAKFFSHSQMEPTSKLSEDVAVKVLLGKDLLQRAEVMAKMDD